MPRATIEAKVSTDVTEAAGTSETGAMEIALREFEFIRATYLRKAARRETGVTLGAIAESNIPLQSAGFPESIGAVDRRGSKAPYPRRIRGHANGQSPTNSRQKPLYNTRKTRARSYAVTPPSGGLYCAKFGREPSL